MTGVSTGVAAVFKDQLKHVIGKQVTDNLSIRHPAEAPDIACRFIVHQLLGTHQVDMRRFATGRDGNTQFLFDEAAERRESSRYS